LQPFLLGAVISCKNYGYERKNYKVVTIGMKMSEEDYELNQKDIDELKKCINWLKGK
jgi:hypothetical protein